MQCYRPVFSYANAVLYKFCRCTTSNVQSLRHSRWELLTPGKTPLAGIRTQFLQTSPKRVAKLLVEPKEWHFRKNDSCWSEACDAKMESLVMLQRRPEDSTKTWSRSRRRQQVSWPFEKRSPSPSSSPASSAAAMTSITLLRWSFP